MKIDQINSRITRYSYLDRDDKLKKLFDLYSDIIDISYKGYLFFESSITHNAKGSLQLLLKFYEANKTKYTNHPLTQDLLEQWVDEDTTDEIKLLLAPYFIDNLLEETKYDEFALESDSDETFIYHNPSNQELESTYIHRQSALEELHKDMIGDAHHLPVQ